MPVRIAITGNTDVLVYSGAIDRPQDHEIIDLCCGCRRRPNLLFFLVTDGGDPDAAYRIARCLQDRYDNGKFSCCISGSCKSAGTLIALGANELVWSPHGELGPLDIQMAKRDELWESESGLTVMTGLTALHEKALVAFEHFLITLSVKSGGRITVRMGSEIAAKLTQGLYAPIMDQIEPLHLGEAFRSMAIAKEYGYRLMRKSRNFDSAALERLISEYPSHSFVIDKAEAKLIFRNVRDCTEDEQLMVEALGDLALTPSEHRPKIQYLTKELEQPEKAPDAKPTTEKQATPQQPRLVESPPKARGDAPADGQAKAV